MLKYLLLVICCAVACSGYNFQDSAFNEELYDNYKDLSDNNQPTPLRFRRDTEEPKENLCQKIINNIKCCDEKPDLKHFEVLREFKKQCFKEIVGDSDESSADPFTCDRLEQIKNNVICIGECVGKKAGLVDDEGNLKKEAVTLIKAKLQETDIEWKKEAADKIVDTCYDAVTKAEVDSTKTYKCNPASVKLAHCFFVEFVKACPKDKQIDSTKCNKLREKLANGGSFLSKGFLLRHFQGSDD